MSPRSEPVPEVVQIVLQWKRGIAAHQDETMLRMADKWAAIEKGLEDKIKSLDNEIRALQARGGVVTENWLRESTHYKQLLEQAEAEAKRYAAWANGKIDQEIKDNLFLGLQQAQDVLRYSPMPFEFNVLDKDAVEAMYLTSKSPNWRKWAAGVTDFSDSLSGVLVRDTALGVSYRQIATDLNETLRVPFKRSLVVARTEGNRAQRTATLYQYQESGVVEGYKRLANKAKACMACLVLDGEFFKVSQAFTDHPNGGCAMVPVIKGAKEPTWETGTEWLERQDPEYQRARMGPEYYDAWKRGDFQLKDMATIKQNSVWGGSPEKAPLKSLIKAETPKEYIRNAQALQQEYYENAKDQRERFEGLMERQLANAGMDKDEVLNSMATLMDPNIRQGINVPMKNVKDILADGELKNTYHFNSDPTKNFAMEYRTKAEAEVIGIPKNTLDPEKRPIYGALNNKPHYSSGFYYGEVELVLDPSVRTRSSFTLGDSFERNAVASPVAHPSLASMGNAMNAEAFMKGDWGHFMYVETQIFGGVDIKRDVSYILVREESEKAALTKLLEKYGYNIPVKLYGT